MKGRALGAAFAAALISALTGSLAWADNPHGTPPGQAKQASTSDSGNSSAAGPSANASATAQANAAAHAESNTQSTTAATAATSTSSPSADSQTKITPGGSKFDNCSGTTNTTTSPGVKPSNDTKHWTCATADSNQTKEYGNGTTAGQGVIARGGSPKTKLYGPGNSQPHMVAPCPTSRHMRDWHAVKNFNPASCSSTSTPSSPSSSSTRTSSTTNTSLTTNSTANTSVTNNAVTNNAVTNNATTNTSSISRTSPSTSSGVQGAQHSSSPKKAVAATAPASSSSPAASTAPATTHGVLGKTATPSSGSLPFTGLPLWLPALLALGLAAAGYSLVRFGRSRV